MFRPPKQKKPSRRKNDPYPHRGTPEGDAKIGTCPQCDNEILRGDKFVVNVDQTVIHVGCVIEWVVARRKARGEAVHDDKFPKPHDAPETPSEVDGTPYDGEFPI